MITRININIRSAVEENPLWRKLDEGFVLYRDHPNNRMIADLAIHNDDYVLTLLWESYIHKRIIKHRTVLKYVDRGTIDTEIRLWYDEIMKFKSQTKGIKSK